MKKIQARLRARQTSKYAKHTYLEMNTKGKCEIFYVDFLGPLTKYIPEREQVERVLSEKCPVSK